MNAKVLPTAAPNHAVKVWADDINVYAEVPSLNSPCVIAFRLSEGGLAKALALLSAKHSTEGGGQPYLRPAVIAKRLIKDGITQPDLDAARAALIEMGIIK